jgi:NAD-dependent deacetylase sirtuin 2
VHYFQKLLVEKNMVHKIYSQNIDALESVANIPDEKIIYAHGSFKVGHCLSCRAEYPFEWIKRNIHEKQFLACESKQCLENKSKPYKLKVVKPDIVFFGEQMPEVFIGSYKSDMNECDCLIVMGTSLAVHPFGSLIDYVSPECPRLLINRDLVSDWLRLEADSDEKNTRDVAFQGNCDDGVAKLAELLGFKKDLFDLMTREEKRLGSEDKLSKTVPDKK